MQIPEEYLPLIAVAAVLFIVLVLLCTILFFKIWGMTNNIIKIRKHALAHDNRLVASALFGSKEKTLEILQEEFTERAVAKYEEYAEETEYKGLEGFQKKMKYWADKYTSSATYLGCPYDFNTALTDLFNKIRVCKEDYPLPKEKGM